MRNYDLLQEVASLGSYTATNASDAQTVANKARALRRVNEIKAKINARFGGRWLSNYREGYLTLVPLYVTGTALFTQGSRTVTGTSMLWTTLASPTLSIIIGPDNAQNRIASVTNNTTLVLAQPYQGATTASIAYKLWQDVYVLAPDAFDVLDFINYQIPAKLEEMFSRNQRMNWPAETQNVIPDVFQTWGRQVSTAVYSTGTVSGTSGTYVLTGSATSWLANLQPGYRITIGSTYYHVCSVDSDTQVTLYQMLATSPSASAYSAVGRNSLQVKFRAPAAQSTVNYSYYRKDYPLVNDDDEDWIAEMYPHVIISGVTEQDYLDKNDPFRARQQRDVFENEMKNMLMGEQGAHHGVTTVGYNIPPSAREYE